MNWKRIAGCSALIFLAMNIVGFGSGLTMNYWQIYGSTIETAIENARHVRRLGYFVVAALLYWRFAVGVAKHQLLHVAAVFVSLLAINFAFELAVYRSIEFDPWALARGVGAALVGYALATWLPRRSRKPAALDYT